LYSCHVQTVISFPLSTLPCPPCPVHPPTGILHPASNPNEPMLPSHSSHPHHPPVHYACTHTPSLVCPASKQRPDQKRNTRIRPSPESIAARPRSQMTPMDVVYCSLLFSRNRAAIARTLKSKVYNRSGDPPILLSIFLFSVSCILKSSSP